ncbi:hypothetical protein [Frigidibacter oleivorans]|uniref:hypothetical protein n=1 Tax=Frigidibacter oleivorans TaxID=2487129 RepID=UPI000F8C5A0C|nr:hypothetical protein [Frigidibacter oleivorans]
MRPGPALFLRLILCLRLALAGLAAIGLLAGPAAPGAHPDAPLGSGPARVLLPVETVAALPARPAAIAKPPADLPGPGTPPAATLPPAPVLPVLRPLRRLARAVPRRRGPARGLSAPLPAARAPPASL